MARRRGRLGGGGTRTENDCRHREHDVAPRDGPHLRPRRLNPESTLTRTPAADGTIATFTGMLTTPERNVTPAAIASAVPAGVMLGPMPNSAPLLVRSPTIQLRLGIA